MTAGISIYWFRNDLRIIDNPAFDSAYRTAATLHAVYIHDSKHSVETHWGFERMAENRKTFLAARLQDLALQLQAFGIELIELRGTPKDALTDFAKSYDTCQIYCEDIAAPEEQADIASLKAVGFEVDVLWQSSLLEPADLPFEVEALPAVFTAFRNKVEKHAVKPRLPLQTESGSKATIPESAAEKHLKHYFSSDFALTYKATRNQPMNFAPDQHFSTKFSPWLACGALSAPMINEKLKQFESERGANDSTYWIWFELLWRDYFRFLHLQNGKKLYRKQGLGSFELAQVPHNKQGFKRWCEGQTGEPLVDAGMRELAATGWLSNRMRQVVASYLIYDLGGDWRAGAAWFEAQLIDYDVYSNQGNWLYIAGRGTDPRGGRRFNPQMQAQQHDADGIYRRFWSQN